MSQLRNAWCETEAAVVILQPETPICGFFFLQQKEAATLGKKVMVLDYVVPTPKGTSWGEEPPTGKLFHVSTRFSCWLTVVFLVGDQGWAEPASTSAAFQRS